MWDFNIVDGVLKKCQGSGTEIIVPEDAKSIAAFAFSDCKDAEKILIPEGVTEIGSYAFADCKNLRTLVIPKSVQKIGMVSFRSCWNLSEIHMPGVVELGDDAFYDCRNLEIIYAPCLEFENSNIQKKKEMALKAFIYHRKDYLDDTVIAGYRKYLFNRKKYVLPTVFTDDLADVLRDYDYGKKITKNNIDREFLNQAMDANATNCIAFLLDWKAKNVQGDTEKKKQNVKIPDSFGTVAMKKIWTYEKKEDGTVILINYKSMDTAVNIPYRIGNDVVSTIGEYAISPERSRRPSKQAEILNKISSVTIPSNIKSIGDNAFSMCWGLNEVFISEGVKSIGDNAFYFCDSLRKITIPASVEYIGRDAFKYCHKLTIFAEEGSHAEVYAKDNGIPFCQSQL